MPKLSDTMTVGTLVKWLKQEGDAVKTGDMLAEVETDKATMELECFFDGVLLKIFSEAGSQVPIGAPLCAVGKPGETVETPKNLAPAAETKLPPPPAENPKADELKAEKPTSSGNTEPQPGTPAAVGPDLASGRVHQDTAPLPSVPPGGARQRISPLARKFAKEKGIDYTRLQGSGRGGRIVRADIVAAETAGIAKIGAPLAPAGKPAPSGPGAPATGTGHFAKGPIQEERTVAVSNMRGTIAKRLLESKTTIPHFYLDIEVDAEPLLALRQQLNTGLEADGVKLSVNDFILKASAADAADASCARHCRRRDRRYRQDRRASRPPASLALSGPGAPPPAPAISPRAPSRKSAPLPSATCAVPSPSACSNPRPPSRTSTSTSKSTPSPSSPSASSSTPGSKPTA
ncbi:2-oxo acid dehydrogenase subunit E2 [Termitidicoccus mucosus]